MNPGKKLGEKKEMISCKNPDHHGMWPIDCKECNFESHFMLSRKLIKYSSFKIWKKLGGFQNMGVSN